MKKTKLFISDRQPELQIIKQTWDRHNGFFSGKKSFFDFFSNFFERVVSHKALKRFYVNQILSNKMC